MFQSFVKGSVICYVFQTNKSTIFFEMFFCVSRKKIIFINSGLISTFFRVKI